MSQNCAVLETSILFINLRPKQLKYILTIMKKLVLIVSLLVTILSNHLFAQEQTSKYSITEKGIVKSFYDGDSLKRQLLVFAPEVVVKEKYE